MKIQDFYNSIKNKNITSDLIIFKITDNNFVANQYIDEIAKQHNLSKIFIDNLEQINIKNNLFDTYLDSVLQIYYTDKFEYEDINLTSIKNLVIISKTVPKKTAEIFVNYIVEIPKLEEWQIKDYLFSQLEHVDEKYLEQLYALCNGDINRLDIEISRLKLFPEMEQNLYFEHFLKDGIYNDLTTNKIFDFTNAIITRDFNKIANIYSDLNLLDASPIGILSILYTNYRNAAIMNTDINASATTLDISSGQFYAIKNLTKGRYSKEQYQTILLLLTNIDYLLKSGQLDADFIIDYLLVNIFSIK